MPQVAVSLLIFSGELCDAMRSFFIFFRIARIKKIFSLTYKLMYAYYLYR
jgi:hypothetical protein